MHISQIVRELAHPATKKKLCVRSTMSSKSTASYTRTTFLCCFSIARCSPYKGVTPVYDTACGAGDGWKSSTRFLHHQRKHLGRNAERQHLMMMMMMTMMMMMMTMMVVIQMMMTVSIFLGIASYKFTTECVCPSTSVSVKYFCFVCIYTWSDLSVTVLITVPEVSEWRKEWTGWLEKCGEWVNKLVMTGWVKE